MLHTAVIDGVKQDGLWVFPLAGKRAKNMTDEHLVTIVGIDGQGVAHVVRSTTLSIRDYAHTVLREHVQWGRGYDNGYKYGANLGSAMIAMLEYGALAQQYFGYRTDRPADELLTDEMKARVATAFGEEALANARAEQVSAVMGDKTLVYGTSCILGESMALKFYFRLTGEDLSALTAEVSYADHSGDTVAQTVPGTALEPNGGYFSLTVDSLRAADAACLVTVTLRRGGETLVSASDSVANYTARLKNEPQSQPLADAMLTYGLAARQYFTPIALDKPGEGEEIELPILEFT
ncbi:MAG: hypothetical protein IJT18_01440 [Oscillospiraceae bacterium]|nr:hypothetical protein [Oscillospiraceae bacterium]